MQLKSGRVASRLALGIGVVLLSACEVPTAMPHWDTTWALPVGTIELTPGSLLPDGIGITADESAFEVHVDGTDFGSHLSDFCDECSLLNGTQAVKPAFLAELEGGAILPADLISAPVVGGQVAIDLYHDFGFDPIRPGEAARGSIELLMLSAGDTLASTTINGVDAEFPSGTTKSVLLPYNQATIRDDVQIVVIIDSPEGDTILVDTSRGFQVVVNESRMLISEVNVRLADQHVDLDESSVKMIGGEGMVNRILGGILRLELDNPFQIAGSLEISLTSPESSVSRTLAIDAGKTESLVEFTGAELRSVLKDEEAVLGASGVVSAVGGAVTIRPDMVLKAKSRFDLTIATKEN